MSMTTMTNCHLNAILHYDDVELLGNKIIRTVKRYDSIQTFD